MLAFLDPPEMILIIVVVLVLFGGSQLPKLAKNLGKAQKEFKEGLAEGSKSSAMSDEDKQAEELRAAEARVAELKAQQNKGRSTDI